MNVTNVHTPDTVHPMMKLGKIPILGKISILSQKEDQGSATIAKVSM